MTRSNEETRRRGCLFYIKRGMLFLLCVIVILPALGMTYQEVGATSDRRTYPAPGQMVDVGGYSLHIHCLGEGSPVVILDAAGGFTSSSWAWVQPEIARTTRVCAYDRAGWGWSDPSPVGYDAEQNAVELHQLLVNARVPGPYILVGHSLGGLYSRVYAQQYPDEVAGLVQVDATHPDVWQRLDLEEGTGSDPTMLTLGPILSRTGLMRLLLSLDTTTTEGLPEREAHELRASFSTMKYANTAQDFDAVFPQLLEQARTITTLGNIPLLVLTINEVEDTSPEDRLILQEMQHELQVLSTENAYVVIDGPSHMSLIHNREYSQTVTEAIKRMIETVISGDPL